MEQPSFTVQLENTELVTGIPVTEASSWDELFALCKQQNELIRDLRNTIANLSESVAYLTRKLYGSSREKLPISGQLDLFGNEAETTGAATEAPASEELLPSDKNSGKKGGKGRSGRKDLFSDVETEKEVIPLPEERKVCLEISRVTSTQINMMDTIVWRTMWSAVFAGPMADTNGMRRFRFP